MVCDSFRTAEKLSRKTELFCCLRGRCPLTRSLRNSFVRYPRGSRPTDIALRAPSRSPPGALRRAFFPGISLTFHHGGCCRLRKEKLLPNCRKKNANFRSK